MKLLLEAIDKKTREGNEAETGRTGAEAIIDAGRLAPGKGRRARLGLVLAALVTLLAGGLGLLFLSREDGLFVTQLASSSGRTGFGVPRVEADMATRPESGEAATRSVAPAATGSGEQADAKDGLPIMLTEDKPAAKGEASAAASPAPENAPAKKRAAKRSPTLPQESGNAPNPSSPSLAAVSQADGEAQASAPQARSSRAAKNPSAARTQDGPDRNEAIEQARELARQGDAAAAERIYESLIALDARDADALAGLAMLRGSGDPSGWLARLEAGIEAAPDHAGLRVAQGMLLADRKEWRAAAKAFEEAARLSPSSNLIYNAAICYDRAGQYREASAAYRKALARSGAGASFERAAVEARLAELGDLR